jgi:hypothetical protein
MMGFLPGGDTHQTFDYVEISRLALGDAAVTSRVECLSHSDFIARTWAVELSKEVYFRIARDSGGTDRGPRISQARYMNTLISAVTCLLVDASERTSTSPESR